MKTCQTFEDLQELGAAKIHERTHMSRHKLELLLNKSFGNLTRLQVMGFISILEREYLIDLSGLREEFDAYVHNHPDVVTTKGSAVLQAPSRARQKWIIGSIIVILLLIGLGNVMQNQLALLPEDDLMKLSTSSIVVPEENLSSNIELNVSEENVTSTENNITIPAVNQTLIDTVTIKPTFNVWVGMIDLNSSQKSEKVTKDPIILEAGNDLLLVFGHGKLLIQNAEGEKQMKDKNMVYFAYENGILRSITAEDFKMKNNGKSW